MGDTKYPFPHVLWLSPHLKETVKDMAAEHGCSQRAIVRKAVESAKQYYSATASGDIRFRLGLTETQHRFVDAFPDPEWALAAMLRVYVDRYRTGAECELA